MKKIFTLLAKKLRKDQTGQERKLWYLLKAKKFNNNKFRRQYPIGKYIIDFCCPQRKLIIELDGGHHNENENIDKDIQRDQFLKSEGFTILRIWNNEIDQNIEGVYKKIINTLK